MENAAIDLNGGDVWDDSALIESWNDALQEYKKYHSIVSKVHTEEDLERELAAAGLGTNGDNMLDPNQEEEMAYDDDAQYEPEFIEPTNKPETLDVQNEATKPLGIVQSPDFVPAPADASVSTAAEASQAPLPSFVNGPLSQVKDETLKKAMMGWYYAGYYTGLYDAAQQRTSGTNDAPQA